jgi:hypothetical protein
MPVALTPGNTAVFTAAPTFSGSSFSTVQAKAFVQSSDTVNFPVSLMPTDAIGLTFQGTVGAGVRHPKSVTLTRGYHNPDGTTGTVTGAVLLLQPAATDDINGGTLTQTT